MINYEDEFIIAFFPDMERIVIDSKIMHGKPVIKGTRVPIEVILGSLIGGMTYEEIEQEYGVKREDIPAAIAYN